MRSPLFISLALIAVSLGGSSLLLARQTVGATASTDTSAKRRLVTTDAHLMHNKPLPSGNDFVTLTGDVVIQSEDSTLHTDKATYDGDSQIATAPGRIRLDDKQNTLTGDKGVAYYATRDAEFTGNIVINARPNSTNTTTSAPQKGLRHDFKDPVTITCDKMRYNWHTKKGVLTGNLTIKQKDRTITGDRGLFDGAAETATLIGHIKSRRPTGESGDADGAGSRAVVCFKEGEEYVEVTRDPDLKDAKVRGVEPLREKPDGDVEPIDSVDASPASTAPQSSPSPAAPQASPAPSPSPAPKTESVP